MFYYFNILNYYFRTGLTLIKLQRDEDFDGSYEGLVSLTQIIGDAKPKSTPSEILEKMEKAQYKDWATADSDKRCPICLDDVRDLLCRHCLGLIFLSSTDQQTLSSNSVIVPTGCTKIVYR